MGWSDTKTSPLYGCGCKDSGFNSLYISVDITGLLFWTWFLWKHVHKGMQVSTWLWAHLRELLLSFLWVQRQKQLDSTKAKWVPAEYLLQLRQRTIICRSDWFKQRSTFQMVKESVHHWIPMCLGFVWKCAVGTKTAQRTKSAVATDVGMCAPQ